MRFWEFWLIIMFLVMTYVTASEFYKQSCEIIKANNRIFILESDLSDFKNVVKVTNNNVELIGDRVFLNWKEKK